MNEILQKAASIIKQNTAHQSPEGSEPYCALALIDDSGFPTVSTITPSKVEGLEWISFCTGLASSKAKRIEKCKKACVCYNQNGAYNISLVGTIEILTDPEIKREMWYDGLKHHFSGPDDPNYCVLRFQTKRYNLLVDWQAEEGTL